MRIDLKSLLLEYGCPTLDIIHEQIISECVLSYLQLRDCLLRMGKILYEDSDNQVYVASIRSGLWNANNAVFAIQLRGSKLMVAGYAKEGLVKQNLRENAFNKLKGAVQMQGAPKGPKRKTTPLIILIVLIVLIAISGTFFYNSVIRIVEATKEYNRSVQAYNETASLYNNVVVLTSVSNINGLPSQIDLIALESESFWDNSHILFSQNSRDKILADAQTISEMAKQVQSATNVITQITAPEESWVANRLSSVHGITGVEAVTEQHDPDGMLGKEGGFTACLYFTFEKVNSEEIPGSGIVEKGTDAGGAIEIYATLADAKARCEYLAGFDGTVLYSGSYAIVGTMVIRTSYKLSNEDQFELTSAITSSLTALR